MSASKGSKRSKRSVAVIQRELREVERHLAEAPPHSGTGVREDLTARAQQLRRELAAARREPGG